MKTWIDLTDRVPFRFVRNDGDTTRVHLVMDLKVNDWLRQFFPELSPWERVENFVVRWTHPVFWKLRWWRTRCITFFWRHYNGSWLHRTRHRLLPKRG